MRPPSRLLLVLHRGGRAGTERHVLWLARALRERGWDVALAVSEDGPILPAFRAARITVALVPRLAGPDPLYVARLARLARSFGAEVLHAHSGRLAVLAGRIARVPALVETRHGLGPVGEPPGRVRIRREAIVCRLAHRTLAVCRTDRARLIAGGLPPERVACVPNGIPDHGGGSAKPPGPGPPIRLGFLGRMAPEKNPLFLADVVREVERRAPGEWRLAVAGAGPLRERLRSELERVRGAEPVLWLGETDGAEPLLAVSNFLLLPSAREGQPLSVLEAMRAGVVTLAHRIPSLVELLGGEPPAGLLLPLDPAAWGESLIALARDPCVKAGYAGEARRRVRAHHRLGTMVDRIERIYQAVFADRSVRC